MQDLIQKLDTEAIESAVHDIVASSTFRSSKQCQLLLRYIVEKSLAHQDDLLRERVIGATVFGRAPDYDTGNDPVVRARVAEVRKRLAQYNLDHRNDAVIKISIPSGSYKAIFSFDLSSSTNRQRDEIFEDTQKSVGQPSFVPVLYEAHVPVEKNQDEPRKHGSWLKSRVSIAIAILLMTVTIFATGLAYVRWHQQRTNPRFDAFWHPLLANPNPAIIYIGANYSYRLSESYLRDYRARHNLPNAGQEFFIDLKQGESVPQKDLVPTNELICLGDVAATGRIIAELTTHRKKYDLRYGSDVTISDLRSSPDIFIGGFSNPWSLRITHGLRYSLEQGDRIIDHKDKSKIWQIGVPTPQSDYAIVSRLVSSDISSFVLAITGIGSASNQAAVDFVSDPSLVKKLLHDAPAGWEKMNMQAVLHANTINGVPTSVEVEAVYFW